MEKALVHRILKFTAFFAVFCGNIAFSQSASFEGTRQKAVLDIKTSLLPYLSKYCGSSCELIKIDVSLREEVSEVTELGFEAVAGQEASAKFFVDNVTVEVQVDERVTQPNRDKLEKLLTSRMRSVAPSSQIVWLPVEVPNIGNQSTSADALMRKAEMKLEEAANRTIQTYCPNKCMLAYVSVSGQLISLDDAMSVPRNQQVRDVTGRSVLRVDMAKVEISIDESIDEARREKISNVMRANMRFIAPLDLSIVVSQFPQTHQQDVSNADDPYGLEKLRRTLLLFRDLAGTKEIITNTTESSESTELSKQTNNSRSISDSSEKARSISSDTSQEYSDTSMVDWALWGGLALAALLIGFLIFRFQSAKKDADIMMTGAGMGAGGGGMPQYDANGNPIGAGGEMLHKVGSGEIVDKKELALKLKVEALKQEILTEFMESPRVTRETFTRMLKEEGVEVTAKYLHLFGYMIVLELIDDPNLTRDLYALAEYFNRSPLQIDIQEEYDLLRALRNRQTAAEIKVLSSRGSDKFEFLERLDPAQIYTLISEEKSQVQSIVLTQLDKKRRMSVFDMYQGATRLALMNELCRADAVPKEYLNNIAKALHKKVSSRPEFDTENIRSSEIIMDLLERSHIGEQRQIMGTLLSTNIDTARAIMMKLVTVEILPYLKDGHLIEIVLGMEREDLLGFLLGAKDHIRDLLLSKAPYELAQSWMEDLEHMASVDEKTYKLTELKIFNKIRSLANSGAISILDINEMIFAVDPAADPAGETPTGQLSNSSMVA